MIIEWQSKWAFMLAFSIPKFLLFLFPLKGCFHVRKIFRYEIVSPLYTKRFRTKVKGKNSMALFLNCKYIKKNQLQDFYAYKSIIFRMVCKWGKLFSNWMFTHRYFAMVLALFQTSGWMVSNYIYAYYTVHTVIEAAMLQAKIIFHL